MHASRKSDCLIDLYYGIVYGTCDREDKL